jgi:hypothetical protein
MAFFASTRPNPQSVSKFVVPDGCDADAIRIFRTCSAVSRRGVGSCCARSNSRATIPVTCGAAMLVALISTRAGTATPVTCQIRPAIEQLDLMRVPGAATSGLFR